MKLNSLVILALLTAIGVFLTGCISSPAKDCGTDINCFITALKDCNRTVISEQTGFTTYHAEILSSKNNKCEVHFWIDKKVELLHGDITSAICLVNKEKFESVFNETVSCFFQAGVKELLGKMR